MFKRALQMLFSLFVLSAVLFPATSHAQKLAGTDLNFVYRNVGMRNTTAASAVARPTNWAVLSHAGFTDSTTWRINGGVGIAAAIWDTTTAIAVQSLPFPPSYLNRTHGAADTLDASPWIVVQVRQDTISYSWGAVETALDSVTMYAQWSADGVSWNTVGGTATRAYYSGSPTGGTGDAVAAISLAELESGGASDCVSFPLQCQTAGSIAYGNPIINRNLCTLNGWLRFVFAVPGGTGQFIAEIGRWQ